MRCAEKHIYGDVIREKAFDEDFDEDPKYEGEEGGVRRGVVKRD
jgi:hypothetical protein